MILWNDLCEEGLDSLIHSIRKHYEILVDCNNCIIPHKNNIFDLLVDDSRTTWKNLTEESEFFLIHHHHIFNYNIILI